MSKSESIQYFQVQTPGDSFSGQIIHPWSTRQLWAGGWEPEEDDSSPASAASSLQPHSYQSYQLPTSREFSHDRHERGNSRGPQRLFASFWEDVWENGQNLL